MLIIDRFEDGFAICESDAGFVKISADLFIGDVKEGDVISCDDSGKYMVLKEETEQRRAKILELLNNLWE